MMPVKLRFKNSIINNKHNYEDPTLKINSLNISSEICGSGRVLSDIAPCNAKRVFIGKVAISGKTTLHVRRMADFDARFSDVNDTSGKTL